MTPDDIFAAYAEPSGTKKDAYNTAENTNKRFEMIFNVIPFRYDNVGNVRYLLG